MYEAGLRTRRDSRGGEGKREEEEATQKQRFMPFSAPRDFVGCRCGLGLSLSSGCLAFEWEGCSLGLYVQYMGNGYAWEEEGLAYQIGIWRPCRIKWACGSCLFPPSPSLPWPRQFRREFEAVSRGLRASRLNECHYTECRDMLCNRTGLRRCPKTKKDKPAIQEYSEKSR